MDRISGTGRGKKDMRKGGNRPGGAGEDKHDNFPKHKEAEGDEEKKAEEPAAEGEEEKKEEPEAEPAQEQPEEEDEEALPGIDFADWQAKKQKESEKGVLKKAKAREHVDNPKEKVSYDQGEKDGIVAVKN